jgi:hypothetical protein
MTNKCLSCDDVTQFAASSNVLYHSLSSLSKPLAAHASLKVWYTIPLYVMMYGYLHNL